MARAEITFEAAAQEHADELREELRGTAFGQLADALTEKVCAAVRGMPEAGAEDVRRAELLIAAQLANGTRTG